MTLNGAHGAIVITNGGERKQEEKWRSCSAGLEDGKWFLQLKGQDNELLPRSYRGIQAFTALTSTSMAVC